MYKPTLIKDKLPNVEGEKFGPIDLETYTQLYEDGYLEYIDLKVTIHDELDFSVDDLAQICLK